MLVGIFSINFNFDWNDYHTIKPNKRKTTTLESFIAEEKNNVFFNNAFDELKKYWSV